MAHRPMSLLPYPRRSLCEINGARATAPIATYECKLADLECSSLQRIL